jgi:hypothetical protein
MNLVFESKGESKSQKLTKVEKKFSQKMGLNLVLMAKAQWLLQNDKTLTDQEKEHLEKAKLASKEHLESFLRLNVELFNNEIFYNDIFKNSKGEQYKIPNDARFGFDVQVNVTQE